MANNFFDTVLDPSSWSRETGQLAILGGKPVVWAGPTYGWQSPETYYSTVSPQYFEGRTGTKTPAELYARAASLKGFDPTKDPFKTQPPAPKQDASTEKGTIKPSTDQQAEDKAETDTSADIDTSTPAKKDPYPGTKIPQEQDPAIGRAFDLIEAALDPERQRQLEDMRLQNLLKSQLLTSALTREGERARYARDIEKANIDAWKERQVAMYNANAVMAAGLGAATMAAFAPPSASALSSTLSAAMQPFSNISLKRG